MRRHGIPEDPPDFQEEQREEEQEVQVIPEQHQVRNFKQGMVINGIRVSKDGEEQTSLTTSKTNDTIYFTVIDVPDYMNKASYVSMINGNVVGQASVPVKDSSIKASFLVPSRFRVSGIPARITISIESYTSPEFIVNYE